LGGERTGAAAHEQFANVRGKLRGDRVPESPQTVAAELDLFTGEQEEAEQCGIHAGDACYATDLHAAELDNAIAGGKGFSSNGNPRQEGISEAPCEGSQIGREIPVRTERGPNFERNAAARRLDPVHDLCRPEERYPSDGERSG
jgi:hypothetical protein